MIFETVFHHLFSSDFLDTFTIRFKDITYPLSIEQEIRIMEAKYSNIHSIQASNQQIPETSFQTLSSIPGEVPSNKVIFEFDKIPIDAAPPTITPQYNLQQVHRLFSVLRYQRCYVIALGKLVGIVTLHSLQEAIQSHAKKIRRTLRKQKYTQMRRQSVCSSVVSSEEE